MLIDVGFLGRSTNTSKIKFKVNVDNIIEIMASNGIRMIKPMVIDSKEFNGVEWVVSRNSRDKPSSSIQEESTIYKDRKGKCS